MMIVKKGPLYSFTQTALLAGFHSAGGWSEGSSAGTSSLLTSWWMLASAEWSPSSPTGTSYRSSGLTAWRKRKMVTSTSLELRRLFEILAQAAKRECSKRRSGRAGASKQTTSTAWPTC